MSEAAIRQEFALLASNDLLMREWIGLATSPDLAELADHILDLQANLATAREHLLVAVEDKLRKVLQHAAMTLPDLAGFGDTLAEITFSSIIAKQRQLREGRSIRMRIIVQPIDGGEPDETHRAILDECTKDGPPTASAWITLRENLAACTRPAMVWTDAHEFELSWRHARDAVAPSSPEPEPAEPPPAAEPEPTVEVLRVVGGGCDACVPLGDHVDEDGHPCQLLWCGCSNGGTVMVIGQMGTRAVPVSVCEMAPWTSPVPQVEGLRRARERGLTE